LKANRSWVTCLRLPHAPAHHDLSAIDLANFEARAMTRAAIVVPVHLPFGQIGAVSFNPVDPSIDDLEQLFLTHGDAPGLMPAPSSRATFT
jgi:hypothetical protein